MSLESAKNEYIELQGLMKFYAGFRFSALTVFAVINMGVISFAAKSQLTPQHKLGVVAIFVVLLVSEVSADYLWTRFAKRSVHLEGVLGYRIYTDLAGAPRFRWRPTTYAIQALYLSACLWWWFGQ